MVEYKVELTTGAVVLSGTSDYIYITLIGTEGNSERTNLDNYGPDFMTGMTGTYTMTTPSSLGNLLLVKLEKVQFLHLPENEWFCSKVVVTTADGEVIIFPCYRWLTRGNVVELRGGRASKAFEDEHPRLLDHRKQERVRHKELFQWSVYAEGVPHINKATEVSALPSEIQFSFSKAAEFICTEHKVLTELKLKGLADSTKNWEDLNDMKHVFWCIRTPIAEYVSEHWKDDDFFGSQFLNGTNPNVIQRCSTLPANFPVKDEMVQPFLGSGRSLEIEMQKGNIFLCDYKRLEGVPTRVVNGQPLPLTAALCLFYKNPEGQLMPIAIQLEQEPSEQNPIFLPSDSEDDWVLAKMFVRNADFSEFEISYHLLGTHLLAEVFAMSTLRNLSNIHPLYKLLIPHFRYTLQINLLARKKLFNPDGPLANGAMGLKGFKELLKRAHSEITYSALCLPENITARGLESIPNYFYRDDGLNLWKIIKSFVQGVLEYYYSSDRDVSRDSELQDWINEIFIHGFLENDKSGIPQRFDKVEDVVKFVTMVIFTVSAQHGALNIGQFDYCSWVPNNPLFLRKTPPTTKGSSNMTTILETLPDVGTTVRNMASVWQLSKRYSDIILLGTYPDQHFDEDDPIQNIKQFQAELSYLIPPELAFSFSREIETTYQRELGLVELKIKGFADSTKTWEDLNMMKQVFWFRKTPISGNIFLCDYKRLEGVPTREFNGQPLPLTAALCLFYKNPEDKLLPIAIQLDQQPSEKNPIFLPSDSEHDWLLAKMFVRNADFTEHQISYHLLGTHLLAEVFAMATLRNLPVVHPLYKLLIPHFRYTVAVNTISFKPHFETGSGLSNDNTLGLEGLKELLKRAHSEMTYSALCLPENITARGLESIPNFYYRDDGLKLWNVIDTFLQKIVGHFYSSDRLVSRDSELQNWISEIFIHGFLGNAKSEIPQGFDTVKQVVQFITMVIFTVSAQHSAVNKGQFDYCSWIPNSPPFLLKPPPTTKGSSSMSTILERLPDIGSTVKSMASMWLQSNRYKDFIPLGSYPQEYFDEAEKYFDVTKQMIKHFQAELSYLSESINERNSTLTLPYNYLNPAEIENSVSQ
ncbi:hypothetical protein DPEC_G00090920 [Dallia pectoralis]|uniref:Uncharacterized protein n=1 Tax=Dallia pectoralis TaxID=75939 RepID=A0ACC2H130_DALPE|nr:hypothetical protein DPEC_G00090920 [Dallia pectoralis]